MVNLFKKKYNQVHKINFEKINKIKFKNKIYLHIYTTVKHNNAKITTVSQNTYNLRNINYKNNYNYVKIKSKEFKFLNKFYIYSIFYKQNFKIIFENMEQFDLKNKKINLDICVYKFINFFKLFSLIYFTLISKKELKLVYEYILTKNLKTKLLFFSKKNYNIVKNKKKSRLKKSRKKRIFKKMC